MTYLKASSLKMISATAGDLWQELPFDFKGLTTPLLTKRLNYSCYWAARQGKS